jgi:hypothetical protein
MAVGLYGIGIIASCINRLWGDGRKQWEFVTSGKFVASGEYLAGQFWI